VPVAALRNYQRSVLPATLHWIAFVITYAETDDTCDGVATGSLCVSSEGTSVTERPWRREQG
jgi:hypothetical protein